MNKIFQQLADEADKWAQTMTWSSDPKYGDRPVSDLFNEKFAELIVQKCLDQCYNRGMNDELYAGQLKAAAYIEEYFGVEEK